MTEVPEAVRFALAGLQRPVCAYVYDRPAGKARVHELRAALPDGAVILYAVKANGHPRQVESFAQVADGLEVASGGELAIALAAGARRIAFGGPAKTDAELAGAVRAARRADVTVNVESAHELRRLLLVADGTPIRIALRVNRSGVSLPGSHRMTGEPTAFGIDEEDLTAAAEIALSPEARTHGVSVDGFHLHAVSNNLDADAHAAFIRDAVDWSQTAAARLNIPLRQVNVGGGLGVDYTGDAAFDLGKLQDGLAGLDLTGVELVLEPGRYLAAPTGWYAAEVIDLKRTRGRWFAVLRGGTHHFRLPAAWGYSHPFAVLPDERWDYPFERPEVRDVEIDAVGELCTPRDVLTRGQHVERLRVADILVFANTGGYGWEISHHEFLRHPYPQMVFI
jgi:2-[(L-alanin-3-ylcarbamoyl)methyl]-2-hydroxybutanedioate decarboxylase